MPSARPALLALPLDLGVVRALRERGFALEALEGEGPEARRARLQTALLALFRDEGSEAAFQALYEVARGSVLAFVLESLRGGRRQDPLELVQDVFVNVYRYAAGFRDEGPDSFRRWVRVIARNLVRRSRRTSHASSLDALPGPWADPVAPEAGPERVVAEREEGRQLARAWLLVLAAYGEAYGALCERDRRAMRIVEVEGRSYREASAILGVGLSNMKMILFRARRRLCDRMAALLDVRAGGAQRLRARSTTFAIGPTIASA
jgi:RNA polymerase sigma factor (sigma-70 family)